MSPQIPDERLLSCFLNPTFTQATAAFLLEKQIHNISTATLTLYKFELKTFSAWLSIKKLSDLTPDHLRRYLLDLSTHRNPGGCHVSYRVLRTFLRWAWSEFDLPSRNPITRVDPPILRPKPLPGVSLPDISAMIAVCKTQRDRAILYCLLDTGARASEFLALNWSHIDLVTGQITIENGKWGKKRVVFLGKKARTELRKWGKQSRSTPFSPVWITRSGQRLGIVGLRLMIRRRALDANLPVIPGIHDFRRAFCLSMLRNGCDLVTVARLMGHAGIAVTQRYLALTDADLCASHAKASPVDNL